MTLYILGRKEGFVQEVASFLRERYSDNLRELVVIVPNVYSANALTIACRDLISGTNYLPSFIPIEEINLCNERIIFQDKISISGYFTNQFVVARALFEASHETLPLAYTVQISRKLLMLLHEFIRIETQPSIIKTLQSESVAAHLDVLSNLLQNVHDRWFSVLEENALFDVVHLCKTNIKELTKLLSASTFLKNNICFVGLTDSYFSSFIDEVLSCKCDVVMPFGYISKEHHYTLTDEDNLKYYVVSNEVKELELINSLILSFLQNNTDKTIYVLTSDLELAGTLYNVLKGYGVGVKNSLGFDIRSHPVAKFMNRVLEVCSVNSSIVDIIALLKDCSFCENELDVEEYVCNMNQHMGSSECIWDALEEQFPQTVSILKKFRNTLSTRTSITFSELLKEHFFTSQELAADLWSSLCTSVSDFFQDLLEESRYLHCVPCSEYKDIFSHLISGKYYIKEDNMHYSVNILDPKDAYYCTGKDVIIPDFYEGVWPKLNTDNELWLSRSMRKEIGLTDIVEDEILQQGKLLEHMLSFCNVTLIRPMKIFSGVTLESRFLVSKVKVVHI
ncbi:hypothetical protein [Candidatus Sneabacter namystus]|uniref:PD-(D/E)XK nuclease family protein n=1 Tax=Candidatus Sneabacter namystus TaxID=2601646 RepID=A0A5C0UJ13_9RICK|nr:hypothetical protein [Candidatus Sneabacter namystus]QEK39442.1 hypothetical protein FZC37_00605 [Candidatus Sneabacter namystus]